MMKIGIDMGHNVPYDTGAAGLMVEDICNVEVGTRVINLLEKLGYEVINCTPKTATSLNDSLTQRTNTANNNKCDYFVSIHFNAGGGTGCEVLLYDNKLINTGNRVAANISEDLKVRNRGIKYRSDLAVLKYTNMPAMLIECLFVDNIIDKQVYDPDKIANAIVEGLTQKKINQDENISKPTTTNKAPKSEIPSSLPKQDYPISMYAYIHGLRDSMAYGVNNCLIGTIGQSLAIEGLSITIDGIDFTYEVHVQSLGDEKGVVQGAMLGTRNANLRIEGIIMYVKNIAPNYKLLYRSHLQGSGWTDWMESGEYAGTKGESRRMEAIEINIVNI